MKKILAFVILFGFVLTGCSSDTTTDVTTIDFWNPFSGPDGQVFDGIVQAFNEEYEGVYEVKTQTIADEYYEKITTTSQTGEGPDASIMHVDQVPVFAENDMIVPWTEQNLNAMNISTSDYDDNIEQAMYYNNELYDIPFDIHAAGWYVNTDLIPEDQIPTSYEEFRELALEEPLVEDTYNVCMPAGMWVAYDIFLQNDVPVMSEDGSTAEFNTAEGVKAYENYMELVNSDTTQTPGDDCNQMFTLGEVGMTSDGPWMAADFDTGNINYKFIPLSSTFGEGTKFWASSHTFVKYNKDLTPEEEDAINAFVGFAIENSLMWVEANQIPAISNAKDSDEVQNDPLLGELAKDAEDFTFYPLLPTTQALTENIGVCTDAIFLGQTSAEEGLNQCSQLITDQSAIILNKE